jgi:hypothetical protein
MAFDVFISHSSKDKSTADATCAALERAGIRAWIAPRDVRPGTEYAAAIIEAIDSCRAMVLIFSSNANASHQIPREIERAVRKGVLIVPMRIEEITPTKSMEYYLGEIHWLDALTPPLAVHLQKLVETIKAILQADVPDCSKSANNMRQGTLFSPAAHASFGGAAKSNSSRLRGFWVSAAHFGLVAMVAILSAGAFVFWQQHYSPPAAPSAATQATTAAKPSAISDPTAALTPAPIPPATTPSLPPISLPAFVIKRSAGFGGDGGSPFDDTDENPNHLQISAVRVIENLNPADTTQPIIGGLQVRWGDRFGSRHGGKGPYKQPLEMIAFGTGEKIGRVDVNWMSYNYPTSNNKPPQWVAGLAIWTDSRVYKFGNMTFGPTDKCILQYGEILLGFFGRSGSYIDQVGCVIGKRK